jgi:hypothetical protein
MTNLAGASELEPAAEIAKSSRKLETNPMKIMQRVEKLERSGILAVTAPVLERFMAALDEAAHRLMGASYESIKDDPGAQERILGDVTSGFCRRLSHADEDRLIAELERIAGVSIDDAIIPAADLADAVMGG